MSKHSSFAVVPAAGRSLRMAAPKLLLPWGSSTVIEHVLSAWRASRVTHVVVVVHPDDHELAEVCRRAGVDVLVAPAPPSDMKASIVLGLDEVRRRYAPTDRDIWLAAPADIPQLSPAVIDLLLAEDQASDPSILVPVHDGRRGHPVLFPWSLAAEVGRLPVEAGLDRLLELHPVREIESPAEAIAADLDTPDDYRRRHNRDIRR